MPVGVEVEGGIAVVTLDQGRGNAIDDALIAATHAALDRLESADVRAGVLTGKGKTFSGGLDLLAIYDFDRPRLLEFVAAFEGLFTRVLAFPKPLVAAVNGHAVAGGAILAMACDHRVLAPGPLVFSINEVLLGISFPSAALEIARRAVPEPHWAEAFLEGRRYTPEEAVARGIAHAVEADVVGAAKAKARALSQGGPGAARDVKAALLRPALERVAADRDASFQRFADHFFGADARARIDEVRSRLLKKSG